MEAVVGLGQPFLVVKHYRLPISVIAITNIVETNHIIWERECLETVGGRITNTCRSHG
jgi:hypothetical protein